LGYLHFSRNRKENKVLGESTMTQLLEKAFKKASKLPALEQNALARWLMDEIISERKWEKAFAESEDMLDRLADQALDEHRRGRTKLLAPGRQ
jgi:hypothetical protein